MGLIKTGLKAAVAVKVGHLVHDRIQARKQAEWEAQGNPAGSTPPGLFASGDTAVDDRVASLTKLADLRASGVLSDAEFEQEKARILNG